MEIVSNNPIIILDGAHNLDKIKTTINSFVKDRIFEKTAKNIHIITGFAKDKDYLAMINEIAKLKPKTVACTRQCQNEFRKIINPWAIAQRMKKLAPHAKCKTFLDPQEAFMWSKKQAKKQDLILSTGSIFLSSELKKN
jgi:dihydrofolate synthase/folylpolyglutamate synthase